MKKEKSCQTCVPSDSSCRNCFHFSNWQCIDYDKRIKQEVELTNRLIREADEIIQKLKISNLDMQGYAKQVAENRERAAFFKGWDLRHKGFGTAYQNYDQWKEESK